MFVLRNVPDHFLALLTFDGFLCLLTERVWHLGLDWWSPTLDYRHTQRKRYLVALTGFLTSGFAVGIVLLTYGVTRTIHYVQLTWSGDLFFKVMIILFLLHLATLIFTMTLAIRYYTQPTKYAKRVLKGRRYPASGYVYTADVRGQGDGNYRFLYVPSTGAHVRYE